jgi:hypothetical protein
VLKAVIDTNVLLSGSVAGSGSPYEILEAWRRGDLLLVTRDDIIAEVIEVLGRPYYRKRRHVTDEIIAKIARALKTEALETKGELTVEVIAQDPDDNKFLACAIEGEADYIVSGDHHLLDLGSYMGIPIVRPAVFLEVLGRPQR